MLRHDRLIRHAQRHHDEPVEAKRASRDLARIARALGLVILRQDPRHPLTLHVYVEGIDRVARSDWVWEGMPRRMASMQDLIDTAIRRCREAGRPLSMLIITGHSGIGGTAAFGSTLDDCVFRGRLSAYQRDQLARLRPYLADDAVIELRQCSAALGNEGTRLLTQVHQASGAAVTGYFGDFYFGKTNQVVKKQVDEQGVGLLRPQ